MLMESQQQNRTSPDSNEKQTYETSSKKFISDMICLLRRYSLYF